jgi:hypothetical protein
VHLGGPSLAKIGEVTQTTNDVLFTSAAACRVAGQRHSPDVRLLFQAHEFMLSAGVSVGSAGRRSEAISIEARRSTYVRKRTGGCTALYVLDVVGYAVPAQSPNPWPKLVSLRSH